ncbi:MAG: DUF2007 domain-containing protein [Bacteroidetes bacterium]|nr:DUF2007 domain-containing protein [Bacteroidota bacterium]
MKTIAIATCKDAIEANFIKNKLELAGIDSFLTNENAATLLPHLFMGSNSGVQIFINDSDIEEAKKIVDLHLGNNEIHIVCPKCSSKNVTVSLGKNKLHNFFKIFISLFANTAPQSNFYSYRCTDCKAEFKI